MPIGILGAKQGGGRIFKARARAQLQLNAPQGACAGSRELQLLGDRGGVGACNGIHATQLLLPGQCPGAGPALGVS